jgi:hypothetical protein
MQLGIGELARGVAFFVGNERDGHVDSASAGSAGGPEEGKGQARFQGHGIGRANSLRRLAFGGSGRVRQRSGISAMTPLVSGGGVNGPKSASCSCGAPLA